MMDDTKLSDRDIDFCIAAARLAQSMDIKPDHAIFLFGAIAGNMIGMTAPELQNIDEPTMLERFQAGLNTVMDIHQTIAQKRTESTH